MIDNAKLHSITIYKHEMDLKLYALMFKVGNCIIKAFKKIIIEIKIDYKFIYQLPKLFITKKFLCLNKR